jgi:hypothetical protein
MIGQFCQSLAGSLGSGEGVDVGSELEALKTGCSVKAVAGRFISSARVGVLD